jgi:hypothetical protein
MIIRGEYLREWAIYTVQQTFFHLIADEPNQEHRSITRAIHEYCRDPS